MSYATKSLGGGLCGQACEVSKVAWFEGFKRGALMLSVLEKLLELQGNQLSRGQVP